jgi:elongation factor P
VPTLDHQTPASAPTQKLRCIFAQQQIVGNRCRHAHLLSYGFTIYLKESRIAPSGYPASDPVIEEIMAALIDAISVKRKMFFEVENTPFLCLEAEVSTPTARGGQTLVRLKMRNLLTRAVFDKTFKASEKFKEPDLDMVQASYLYSDGDVFHFMDQDSFDTLTLSGEMIGDALDFIVEGVIIQIHKYNGNPIGLQLPPHVELKVTYTEPGARGDTASGNVTKSAKLETGIEIRVPLFIKEGEKVKVSTETREFAGRA